MSSYEYQAFSKHSKVDETRKRKQLSGAERRKRKRKKLNLQSYSTDGSHEVLHTRVEENELDTNPENILTLEYNIAKKSHEIHRKGGSIEYSGTSEISGPASEAHQILQPLSANQPQGRVKSNKRFTTSQRKRYKKLIAMGMEQGEAKITARHILKCSEMFKLYDDYKLDESLRKPKLDIQTILSQRSVASTEMIRIAVMDANFPSLQLPNKKLNIVFNTMVEKASIMNDEWVKPEYLSSDIQYGCLILTCANEIIAKWALKTGMEIKPWEEAELKTVKLSDDNNDENDNKIVVVPEDFTAFKFTEIEKRERLWGVLHIEINNIPKDHPKPQLLSISMIKGVIIIVCGNKHTKDWLNYLIPRLSLWYNDKGEIIKLKTVSLNEILTNKRVSAWIPGPPLDNKTILNRFAKQNKGLVTMDWRIYDRYELSNGIQLIVSLNYKSLEIIKKYNWKLACGTGQAVFVLCKSSIPPKL